MVCGIAPDIRGQLDRAMELGKPGKRDARIAEIGTGDWAAIRIVADDPALPSAAGLSLDRLVAAPGPGPGRWAVYLDENRAIAHVAVFLEEGMVRSRWAEGLTCRHGLFDLPRALGEMVRWVEAYAPSQGSDR